MPPSSGDLLSSVSSTVPSPAATDPSSPSLSASPHANNPQPLTQILVLYHKATSTFLLRQLASAYSTSLEALELLARTNQEYGLDHSDDISTQRSFFILKQKLWILHATIFGAMLSDRAAALAAGSEHTDHHSHPHTGTSDGQGFISGVRKRISGSSKDSPEKLVKDLWRRLVEDYGGLEGDVDGQVMVPFTMLCVNQKLYTLARHIIEAYMASIPDGMLIHLETAAGVSLHNHGVSGLKDPVMTNYERLVELYLIHVLAKLNEWDSAADFLKYNTVLSDNSKKTYGKILDKLHQKSLRPKKSVVKKQQHSHQPTVLDSQHFASKSVSSVTSPTALSTAVSSPTLSSASTMGSPSPLRTLEPRVESSSNSVSAIATDTKKSQFNSSGESSSGSQSAQTKIAVSKKAASALSSVSTLQGRMLLFLQHYGELIKSASKQMGTNQLMIIVGVVVFLGALSRNRTRASKYLKAGMAKVMQTVKMGTTVTSI
ncbi:hypothetical protein BGZ99_003565 [Dissophora globulifera]|uniref:Uncharacterized protein n=1 Tax=Dissophora globulifera TaxID=979702 RepID=A0A9P6UVV5_9FUNG|nr:hypothetical protein BGZ99_003565 [Dissophora globulifera]